MSEVTLQAAQQAAMLLSASIKSVLLYPQAHPAVRQPLHELCETLGELLEEKAEIHLGVVDGIFFLESRLIVSPNAAVAELTDRLMKKRIFALTIYAAVTADDLFKFASLLARRDSNADLLPAALEKQGITTIRLGIDEMIHGDDSDDAGSMAAGIYHEALSAVRDTMNEVETGRIPTGEKINKVVGSMVSVTIKDHTTLLGLAMIKDYHNYTFSHSVNVGILAVTLGAYLGLDQEALQELNTAGLLHDIGKTQIDKAILDNPGKLSDPEFEQMKKHAEKGSEIVSQMKGVSPRVAEAVLGHHIKYNRTGYPEWATGRQFSHAAEIVAVADCYDAITTLRAYQVPTTPKAALDIMRRLSGTTLNGELVEQFATMMGEYPVGTFVRLDNSEIALVVKPHPMENSAPAVKVVMDAKGEVLAQPRSLSLGEKDGSRYASIISSIDPLTKNLDTARYLLA